MIWARFWLLGLAWLAIACPAGAAPPSLPRVELFGQPHIRLDQWCAQNRLRLIWKAGEKTFQVTNATHRLEFELNSRRMSFNGVSIFLSWPVALWRDVPHLSEDDRRNLLEPLCHPRRNPAGRPVQRVVLDPGHGGKDPGHESGKRQEKHYTLLLAQEVRARLQSAGLKVSLTRTQDTFLDLNDRPAMAQRLGADLFVSLHFNAAPSAKGAEVYCLPPAGSLSTGGSPKISAQRWPGNAHDAQNILLAYHLQRSLTRQAGLDDRGVRRGRFSVLRPARMPAALVEAGFMTDPGDAKRIHDLAERRRLAEAIANGILAYKRSVDPHAASPKR
jgi:N-acetylmuramoyl-L-alanine amidase